MHRNSRQPGRTARKLACAAVALPVLLVATGCSSDSGSDGDSDKNSSSPSADSSPSLAPAKFADLPESCKTVSEDTVKDTVPGAEEKDGKELPSSDTKDYGACLWSGGSGENDTDYRSLTVSFKRYDSQASLGSGDERAGRYYDQELKATTSDDEHKGAKQSKVGGLGQQAVSISYETTKKKRDYRVGRVLVRHHNAVLAVDYEGTGFEGADPPSADEVREKAEKVAKEAVKALK